MDGMSRRRLVQVRVALCGAGLLWCVASGLAVAQEASNHASEGIYSVPQADAGEAIYAHQCATCHGGDLTGLDSAPSLSGGRFVAAWSGQPVSALSIRIRTTMPLTQPGSLTLDQTASLTAYILLKNGFKAGNAPLPSRLSEQKQLLIDQPKS